jgi:hypothetical protein
MSPTSSLPATGPRPVPLYAHAGNGQQVIEAGQRLGTGPTIWRGSAGAKAIAAAGADPVTGLPAWIDFATHQRAAGPPARPPITAAEVVTLLSSAQTAVGFAPGVRADHNNPAALTRWFQHDMPAERAQLLAAGWSGDLIPVVVVNERWLTTLRLQAQLQALIAAEADPVALVMMGVQNPMHDSQVVIGAVDLVASTPNVMILRSDEAAVGLVANGAALGSVGTSSTVRLDYLGSAPKNRRTGLAHKVFDVHTASWIEHYRLDLYAAPRRFLNCPCSICGGRSIQRFSQAGLVVEAQAHSVACLQQLHATVMSSADPTRAWIDICAGAVIVADQVQALLPAFSLGQSARAWTGALQPTP